MSDAQQPTLRQSPDLPAHEELEAFIVREQLPDGFREVVARCYRPLARWLHERAGERCPLVVGISGAQGTGKSTLAGFFELFLAASGGFSVAVLSLDDFYYTHAERHQLGLAVHPLLATRGVPGTHDLQMLSTCLDQLRLLQPGRSMALPRFDKAQDDRSDPASWPVVDGPIDVIVLEGWCLGAEPQQPECLGTTINALERVADSGGIWRRYVNEQLAGSYASLFDRFDHLVFLKAPDFDAVRRWRVEQERKLARRDQRAMSDAAVGRFLQHFERLTRAMLESTPPRADVVVQFDEQHACTRLDWRSRISA